jgi:hypothetical protein
LASLGAKVTHFSPLGGPPVWQDCVSSLPVGEIFEKGKNFDAVIVGGGDIIQSVMASTKVYGKKNLRTIFGYPSAMHRGDRSPMGGDSRPRSALSVEWRYGTPAKHCCLEVH